MRAIVDGILNITMAATIAAFCLCFVASLVIGLYKFFRGEK